MSTDTVNYPTDADCHSILTDNDSLRARIDALAPTYPEDDDTFVTEHWLYGRPGKTPKRILR